MAEFGIINTNCWQETKIQPKVKSYVNTDEPKVIHVIQTGWEQPPMFSVVIENGDIGRPKLEFLDENQIKRKYNITI